MRGLGRSFGARTVLRDIEWEIAPCAVIALVGPSGSGKSTLLRVRQKARKPFSRRCGRSRSARR
ncbi:ATP-binding cassette domain-containing protein [Nocardia sp. NPDC049707]|uniref:ATP-binding cassette domain-containing protein n=1 Tax=Nocardia sp. NPDC049707 TaxID=3154735 RepID=UPI003442F6C3